MKKLKYILLITFLLTVIFVNTGFSRESVFRTVMFTHGKLYQADNVDIPESELDDYDVYVEMIYNSSGKLLEENFFVLEVLVCKRIYSPRFDKSLREEIYKIDNYGNKTIIEIKNYYGEQSNFREKKITSVVYDKLTGGKEGVYVEYELFSVINDVECKRIKQRYEGGQLQYSWIYYYDIDGSVIAVEERNSENFLIRVGRPDYSRLQIGEGDFDEAIIWKMAD